MNIQAPHMILESFFQYLSLFTREKLLAIVNMKRKSNTSQPKFEKFNFIDNDAERIDELKMVNYFLLNKLSIPASFTTSGRLFSYAEKLLRKDRCRLKPEILSALGIISSTRKISSSQKLELSKNFYVFSK